MTDDNIEWTLRTALDAQARRIEVAPDALTNIRARTRRRRRAHRGGFMVTLSTGTGVLAATAVFAFASVTGGCQSKPTAANPPTTAPISTPATAPVTAPASTVTVNVPVYYVGQGGRLYREYHHVAAASTSTAGQLTAAISQLFGQTALDPDYRSPWPAGASVRSVTVAGGVATVDLHGVSGFGVTGVGSNGALEQLIWTATAFTGGTGMKVLVDGAPVPRIAGRAATGVLHRGPAVDVLAPIWIIDPQQGATTGRNVTINVAGIVFEAQFSLQIHSASGQTVGTMQVHLSAGAPAQGTATVGVKLAPGTYTIEAYDPSFKDGSQQLVDSHTFTVTS